MANYPSQFKERSELNLRLGIKSSLSQLRSVIASLYVIYLANNKQAKVTYSQEFVNSGLTSIKLDDNLAQLIDEKYPTADKSISSLVNGSSLFSAQLEALQVGIELFFHLAKINFVATGLSERTGSSRFQKKLCFATNMILVDLYLSSHSHDEVNKLLVAWLNEKPYASKLEDGLKILLNTFTEETQYKIRDNNLDEIIFNQEGVYNTVLNEGEVVSKDANEPVGPFRIYKSYVASGMHPYLIEHKHEFKLNENTSPIDLDNYFQLVSTTLDITPRKITIEREIEPSKPIKNSSSENLPLQQIFYGAPGTGKSHETNETTRKYPDTIRTTFHPDSDYSTFVGAYKPTMEKSIKQQPIIDENALVNKLKEYLQNYNNATLACTKFGFDYHDSIERIKDETSDNIAKLVNTAYHIANSGYDSHVRAGMSVYDSSYKNNNADSKIVYKFIKQAFLKAYIQAWKKMCNARVNTQIQTNSIQKPIILSHPNGNLHWEVTNIDDSSIYLTATEVYNKEKFKNDVEQVWKTCWINNIYQGNLTNQNRPQICVCNWMAEFENPDFEFCWTKFLAELSKGEMELNVDLMGDCKPYFYNDAGNNINMTRYVCGKKDAIIKQDVNSDPTKYQKAVAIYLHSNYNSYPLEDAWNKFKEDFNSDATTSILSTIPQFLVIEEINRGNCAQIFGDIFQLLDRTDNGYSQYPIEADEDIQKALLDPAPADGLSFGPNGLQLSDAIKQQLKVLNDNCPDEIVSKVCCGQLLVLPPNLHIWATMNTSDQSLFPIDSAFKRRWDWQYKPIQDAGKNWKILVENSQYDWWQFIDAINQQINITTSSEDKKLGYFFCKPCEGTTIKADKVVNKVIFYLWNDVFKDYDLPAAFNYGDSKKKPDGSTSEHMSFNDFYTDQAVCIHQLMKNLKVIDENAPATPAATPETASDTTTTEVE